MFFTLAEAKKVDQEGFTAFLYNEKSRIPAYNAVYVDVRGAHDKEYVKTSHRVYFVIEGTGTFTVDDETRDVQTGDVIAIPPKTPYSYEGKMKLFEINFPATDSSDAVKVY